MNVFILSASSDIGKYLAKRFTADGHRVVGTYRNETTDVKAERLIPCDLKDREAPRRVREELGWMEFKWDLFISCVGDLAPIGNFFDTPFCYWADSFNTNMVRQLGVLHELYQMRAEHAKAVFFAGGRINGVLENYSAYSVAKVALVKMVEQLAAESDLHVTAIGPGWVDTKIHEATLEAKGCAGENLKSTLAMNGTDMASIYDCIRHVIKDPNASGANVSVRHDTWREPFPSDKDSFRLRRSVPTVELLPP